jgi:hypothetical protein
MVYQGYIDPYASSVQIDDGGKNFRVSIDRVPLQRAIN